MQYFIDTEFHSYKRKPLFGKAFDTIELISVGIVSEDSREFYAISKDFDVEAAWNNEWLRENVLKPIWAELIQKERYAREYHSDLVSFTYKGIRNLIKWNGKSNEQIVREIISFIAYSEHKDLHPSDLHSQLAKQSGILFKNVQFYGYMSTFDYVVLTNTFGGMDKWPSGFPYYFNDMAQMLDEKVREKADGVKNALLNGVYPIPEKELQSDADRFEDMMIMYKSSEEYPKEPTSHHALLDAKWNLELYKFIQTL